MCNDGDIFEDVDDLFLLKEVVKGLDDDADWFDVEADVEVDVEEDD